MKLQIRCGNVSKGPLPPSAQKVKDFLDALPEHQALGARELCADAGINYETMTAKLQLLGPQYRIKRGNFYLYGNPKTIANAVAGKYDQEG